MSSDDHPASEHPTLETLREIGLFGGLTDQVLTDFVLGLPVIDLSPGDVVFREGEVGRELFVVMSGEMEVMKLSKNDREARVAMLGPGDWFGEMSILDVMPRSATMRVVSPASVIKLSATDLDSLYRKDLKAYSIIVLNIAREISRRLRVADGIIAELVVSVTHAYLKR